MTEKGARRIQLDLLCADSSSEHRLENLNAVLACSRNIKAKHLVNDDNSIVASEQDWENFSELLFTSYFEFQVEKKVYLLL